MIKSQGRLIKNEKNLKFREGDIIVIHHAATINIDGNYFKFEFGITRTLEEKDLKKDVRKEISDYIDEQLQLQVNDTIKINRKR